MATGYGWSCAFGAGTRAPLGRKFRSEHREPARITFKSGPFATKLQARSHNLVVLEQMLCLSRFYV